MHIDGDVMLHVVGTLRVFKSHTATTLSDVHLFSFCSLVRVEHSKNLCTMVTIITSELKTNTNEHPNKNIGEVKNN